MSEENDKRHKTLLDRIFKSIRTSVRFVVGAVFWLRPLVERVHLHLPVAWEETYSRTSPTVWVLFFITYYALLSEGGWLSVAVDIAYVYFWPLRLVWIILKSVTIRLYRLITKKTSTGTVQEDAVQSAPLIESVASLGASATKETGVSLFTRLVQPFLQFFLLWAILLLNTSNVFLTWIALIVISVGAIRIVRSLSLFLSDAGSWISKLKGNFATQITEKIARVREYQSVEDTKPSKDAAGVLNIYSATFGYMSENKNQLAKWTIIASILITIPFYLYLSFIFTSIYLGVARLNNIHWLWSDALTTSIFIPFAYTDLPHNVWIRLIGGCQALTVSLLGYTVLFRRMQRSVQQLSQSATELRLPLTDEGLKQMMVLLNTPTTNVSGQAISQVKSPRKPKRSKSRPKVG